MALFAVVFLAMLAIVGLMSVGVIMGKKPISGSCGGMSALGMDVACDVCKGDKSLCESEEAPTGADSKAMTYDAAAKKK